MGSSTAHIAAALLVCVMAVTAGAQPANPPPTVVTAVASSQGASASASASSQGGTATATAVVAPPPPPPPPPLPPPPTTTPAPSTTTTTPAPSTTTTTPAPTTTTTRAATSTTTTRAPPATAAAPAATAAAGPAPARSTCVGGIDQTQVNRTVTANCLVQCIGGCCRVGDCVAAELVTCIDRLQNRCLNRIAPPLSCDTCFENKCLGLPEAQCDTAPATGVGLGALCGNDTVDVFFGSPQAYVGACSPLPTSPDNGSTLCLTPCTGYLFKDGTASTCCDLPAEQSPDDGGTCINPLRPLPAASQPVLLPGFERVSGGSCVAPLERCFNRSANNVLAAASLDCARRPFEDPPGCNLGGITTLPTLCNINNTTPPVNGIVAGSRYTPPGTGIQAPPAATLPSLVQPVAAGPAPAPAPARTPAPV